MAGGSHDLPRERHRARADGAECARRARSTASASRVLPCVVRRAWSKIPALLRALVACGWFGIQAWIGGAAIHKILAVFFPSMAGVEDNVFGITLSQFLCFLIFWGINVWVIHRGIDTIRWLLNIKAPLLLVLGLALLWWAYQAAGRIRADLLADIGVFARRGEGGAVLDVLLPPR